MNIQTNSLEQLVVTRDNQIDSDWLRDIEHKQRKEALEQAGKLALAGTVAIAKGIVWLMTPVELRNN